MSTAITLKRHDVIKFLERAEKYAFTFVVHKENRFNAMLEKKQVLINKVGKISTFWSIMSIIGILLAIVFAIYEANMAKNAIVGLLDSQNEDGVKVNNGMIAMIGAGLAVFAMFIGHIFSEGFKSDINEITGRSSRNIGFPFYFSIAGILSYIGAQYYLVQASGHEKFTSFALMAVGVAILEILVGVLILGKSLTYTVILLINIQLWFLIKGMAVESRKTNDAFRDYRAMRDAWNAAFPTSFMELEGNDNIRRAIAYYGGIKIDDDGDNPPPPVNDVNNAAPPTDNPDTDDSSNQADDVMTEDDVEAFIEDIDQNIKF